MPGLECSKVRKAMDTRLKSGRGRALEKQKMGQGGGFTERRGGNTGDELLQGISTPRNKCFYDVRIPYNCSYNYETCNV